MIEVALHLVSDAEMERRLRGLAQRCGGRRWPVPLRLQEKAREPEGEPAEWRGDLPTRPSPTPILRCDPSRVPTPDRGGHAVRGTRLVLLRGDAP